MTAPEPSPRAAPRARSALVRLARGEAGAGLAVLVATVAALLLANSPLGAGWQGLLSARISRVHGLETPAAVVSDALMAVFFFVVGLEIKREALTGALASAAQRRLPVLLALAGMAVPAALFLALTAGHGGLVRGWAVPTATDIAFAVGVLALAGGRLPPGVRLLLLSVAVVDDLGAVTIIALLYTRSLALGWLLAAAGLWAGLLAMGWIGVRRGWPYLAGAAALWWAVLHAGIHPTIAGVLAALAVPLGLDSRGHSVLIRLEHALAPLSAYGIVPLFALVSAGVAVGRLPPGAEAPRLALGIALALALGKPVGIFGALLLARRTGFAAWPEGATPRALAGLALLCGIGFTMSLFLAQLAFAATPTLIAAAKAGILAGSALSAVSGYLLLRSVAL